MTDERLARIPETPSPYAEIESTELIGRFYDTEGDPSIGRELSARIFEHAGFAGDPSSTPLIGRDGSQIEANERALMLADYINFAVQHHFDAVPSILDFLTMEKGSPEYETMRTTVVDRLNARGR